MVDENELREKCKDTFNIFGIIENKDDIKQVTYIPSQKFEWTPNRVVFNLGGSKSDEIDTMVERTIFISGLESTKKTITIDKYLQRIQTEVTCYSINDLLKMLKVGNVILKNRVIEWIYDEEMFERFLIQE